MLRLENFDKIYVHRDPIDFRKQVNGLCEIVESELKLEVFKRYLFVFISRSKNRLKVLYWDQTGFAMWYKRLEQQRFKWAHRDDDQTIIIDERQLRGLLKGFDVFQKEHKKLHYSKIV